MKRSPKIGGRRLGSYFTFGRYDFVSIIERPDNAPLTSAMKRLIEVSDYVSSETLIAIKSEEMLERL
jgi:uncharacterized protein with GYD domain